MAVTLLVGAGLLVQSLLHVGRVDTGFDPGGIVTSDLMLYGEKYRDDPALALAFLGIYGVMSHLTSQRKIEIGIRMALGADPGEVVRMVVRHALATAAFGTAIGYLGAIAATRAFRSLLFGIRATDAATYVATGLFVLGIALVAGYVPAKRASQVDPARVLTAE